GDPEKPGDEGAGGQTVRTTDGLQGADEGVRPDVLHVLRRQLRELPPQPPEQAAAQVPLDAGQGTADVLLAPHPQGLHARRVEKVVLPPRATRFHHNALLSIPTRGGPRRPAPTRRPRRRAAPGVRLSRDVGFVRVHPPAGTEMKRTVP